jgi:hypothetical protein
MFRVNQLNGFGGNAAGWARTPIADQARGFGVNGWAFRKLLASYTGPCCRLVRSSDNAQSDFGFTPQGYVDISAINTWLGGASAEKEIWYDQIGSTNWVSTFGTTGDRPNLVISGSRVWVETIVAGGFTGGPSLSAWTALVVGRPQPSSWRTVFWTAANNSPVLIENGSDRFGRFDGSFTQFGSETWASAENASFYLNFMGNPVTASKNNGAASSAGTHSATRAPNGLGLNPDTGGIQPFGRIDEVVLFNADLPTDLRAALNANQRAFYSI